MNKNRMEAFSDGVFAIVITLVVLEFKVPEAGQSLGNPFYFMLITYITTFMLVTSFWISHHHDLNFLKKADFTMLWINNISLFPITLLPFTTIYHGLAPSSRQAAVLYSANYGLIVIGLYLLGFFIMRRMPLEKRPDLEKYNRMRFYLSLGWCVPATALAYFVPWTATFTTLAVTVFWTIRAGMMKDEA